MELHGSYIGSEKYTDSYWFKAKFKHRRYLFYSNDENEKIKLIPDSEDIQKLKQVCDFSENEMMYILNYCITNEYIKKHPYNDNLYTLKRKGKNKADKYEKQLKKITNDKNLILDQNIFNIDDELTKLIKKARILYLNNETQLAIEKIWDALERIKTVLNTDKKKGISYICNIADKVLDKDYINEEFKILTKIGNEYQIRHFETDKKELKDKDTMSYIFTRAFSLVIFSIKKISSIKNINQCSRN